MSGLELRALIGLVLMATACSIAFRFGGSAQRMAAGLIAMSWAATAAGEITTADGADFDPASGADQNALAEDLLHILSGVVSATVYSSAADLHADED